VTPQEDGADIAVEARLVGDKVRITVSDTGQGETSGYTDPTSSTGVGLANIRDRLQQAYGDEQSFTYGSSGNGGFTVTIEMPLRAGDVA
jgi:sensor histidine kinase YesM